MPNSSKKMQQRTALMSILNKYRDVERPDNAELKEDIDKIIKFENQSYVCKTLFREMKDTKNPYTNVCAIIAIEAIDDNVFEKEAIDFLKDEKISDNRKFFIISLLKQKGIGFDYNDISLYIKNPEKIAQSGVQDFLINAIEDPEVQIDLLDFYLNIPKEEKLYLLDNLINEFDGDDLANAFSLLAELDVDSDELEILIRGLIKAKSPYALDGLKYILEKYEITKILKTKIEKAIKEISFSNPNFINMSLIKNSEIFKCFISFVDGHSDFSLVFSRKREDNSVDALLMTANIALGITSCMGFGNITIENFNSIIKRLFSDSMPVNINPIALKSLFLHYFNKSKKLDTDLPYELIVWKKIMNDVKEINYDISEFINSKLETLNLSEAKVKKFSSSKMLETWYYSYQQNEKMDEIINRVEKKHSTNLDDINEIVSKSIDEFFLSDNDFLIELQSKLLIQSYVASLAKLKVTSACAYSLCFKNPYIKMLVTSSIDKSLYYYFSTCLYESEESNRFKKKIPTNFSCEELEVLMNSLETKWS